MMLRAIRNAAVCVLVVVVATLVRPAEGRAATTFNVAPGWDLFQTDPTATTFPGLGNLMGVPLGTFNFNGTQNGNVPLPGNPGNVATGGTDTIIERLTAAIPPSPPGAGSMATINLAMVALQLETVTPVNFSGLGLDNYFVTLQAARPTGGPNSTGTMTITWNANGLSGTFSSSLDVFFDIRKGSLTGAIVASQDLVLTSSGTAWSDLPPPGAFLIPGANLFLAGGSDNTKDFWVNPGPVREVHPNGSVHQAFETGSGPFIPEPASIVMFGFGAIGIAVFGRWRRTRAA
jgi:hypothetical protein